MYEIKIHVCYWQNALLKRQLEELQQQANSATPVEMPEYQIGDWNRNLLQQKMADTSQMIAYKTMVGVLTAELFKRLPFCFVTGISDIGWLWQKV